LVLPFETGFDGPPSNGLRISCPYTRGYDDHTTTRQQVDRAAPLDFTAPSAQPEKQANITIEAGPLGLTVRCEYTGTLASIPAAIERLRAAGVLELVSGGKVAPGQNGGNTPTRKPNTGITPAYDGAGQPMCPVHHKPLTEGRYRLFCPSRADGSTPTPKAIAISASPNNQQ
jgi:hypothetical protein